MITENTHILPKVVSALSAISVGTLATECKREISAYGREDPSSDAYSVELLRRATMDESQEARAPLQECLSEVVRNWLHHHPRWETVRLSSSEEEYIAHTFERFWQATAYTQEGAFGSLAVALEYLRASLNGALLETLRAFSRPGASSISEPYESEERCVQEMATGAEVWVVLQSILPDAREQRLAYLLFHCGLRPKEIIRYCPQEFDDLREISRLRRNLMEHLLRNAALFRRQLTADGDSGQGSDEGSREVGEKE
jgi:hypothetical protein